MIRSFPKVDLGCLAAISLLVLALLFWPLFKSW